MNHQSTLTEHATKMKHDAAQQGSTRFNKVQQGSTTLISCSKRSPSEQFEIVMLKLCITHS